MRIFRRALWLIPFVVVCFLLWGDALLIATDPVPQHVDTVIALQGSVIGERVRIAGAMDYLRKGIADHALLSVPQESFWGQSIPPAARAYLQRNYGADLASRVDFCETSADVNSTVQEAQELMSCMRQHHWQTVLVVTSDYHTRRARMLWKRVNKIEPKFRIWVEGVADPEFQHPWWRHRQSAKTWVMECSKLAWASFGG